MRPTAVTFVIASSLLLVTACSTSAAPGGATQSPSAPAASPAASTAASAAATQSGPATSLDPCQLVTSSEASSLAGASYGPGMEQTSGGGKQCVYGYQTTNVFMVEVGQGHDPATAQRQWSQAKAKAQALISSKMPAGMKLSIHAGQVTGLADRAETLYGSTSIGGQAIGFSGIYLLKGATFLAFEDLLLGHAPPSTAAMQSEAQTALGRVP